MHHLSPPERFVPGATVYVVWAKQIDADNPPTSLGALRVDKDLNGRLDSLMATAPAPTGKVVLNIRITPRA